MKMSMRNLLAASVGVVIAGFGTAYAQDIPEGRVYTFHSRAQKGCPALDWHVVAGTNGALSGMIAWNNMKSMAHATGSANMQTRTFEMTATEVSGQHRTATITGTVRQDGWLVAAIKGPGVNCQGVNVPWFTQPPPNG
jgi:hypothetical protein